MAGVIVVGAQWGDEGKGKIIDLLTSEAKHIVRAQGGNNAGHTIIIGEEEYKLHLTPSGILHPHTQCYISAGTVIDPEVLVLELNALKERGVNLTDRLWISPAAHIIFPYHKILDQLLEMRKEARAVGTTGRGIGPCYSDKANRIGIRVGELIHPELFPKILATVLQIKNEELTKLYGESPLIYEEILSQYTSYAEYIAPFVKDVELSVDEAVKKGDFVLFEGAQGTFLDSTSGTYPYVTSSSTVAAGICVGAGVGPSHISHTLGVMKSYTTRVGRGPLPSEVDDENVFLDHSKAREFGTTTSRKRRIGWFDAILGKTAVRLNGLNSIALTKLDILDDLELIKICVGYKLNGKTIDQLPSLVEDLEKVTPIYETVHGWNESTAHIKTYEDLPQNAKKYLQRIEKLCGTSISMISVGPARDQTIILYMPSETCVATLN